MKFITKMPYLHNCYPHLVRNRNISYKKLSLNMLKIKKKSNLDCFNMQSNTNRTYHFFNVGTFNVGRGP